MANVLIVLGVLLVMGVIVVALLRVAPKHEKEVNNAFEELARRHGLRYQAEDDGRVQEFVRDFDGIGQLESQSSGRSNPKDVVSGVLDGQRIFVFRLDTRDSEGSAREWSVAGLQLKKPIADRCSLQFCPPEGCSESTQLHEPIVKEQEIGSYNVVVRSGDSSGAGRLTEEKVLGPIAARAGQLAFRPELQVRGARMIAYPADRHTTIDHANELDRLLALVKTTADIAR